MNIMAGTMAQNQVILYSTLSNVFLAVGILFLVISVVLFFVFHIAGIFSIKTGRAQRRMIREMEDLNAETGRLQARARSSVSASDAARKMWNTSQLDTDRERSPDTNILDTAIDDTTVLNVGYNETTVLNPQTVGMSDTSTLAEDIAVPIGKFVIVREIMMIHTEEAV